MISDAMEEDVFSIVRHVVAGTLHVDPDSVKMEQRIEDICEDSIQMFSLVMNFEKKFQYRVKYDDLMRIETIRDIAELISCLSK